MACYGTNSSRRYHDEVGFVKSVETDRPGIYENKITKRKYYGDILKDFKQTTDANTINGGMSMSVKISIAADKYAEENFHHLAYATYMGVKWQIVNAEPARPRIILTLGGEYIEHTE